MVITFRCDSAACTFSALKLLSLSSMQGCLTFLEKRKETDFLKKKKKKKPGEINAVLIALIYSGGVLVFIL